MRAPSHFINLILLVVELLCSRLTYAQGMYIGDGKGGYCTMDGTPTAERPQCSKAQVEAGFPAPGSNPADQYVQRKNQALQQRANSFLHQPGLKAVPCERVIAVVGGGLEQPYIAAIVCQNANVRVLYEVLNQMYSPDRHPHVRVATADQIDTDVETLSQGFGLAGDWWRK